MMCTRAVTPFGTYKKHLLRRLHRRSVNGPNGCYCPEVDPKDNHHCRNKIIQEDIWKCWELYRIGTTRNQTMSS